MKKGDYITKGQLTRKVLAVIDEELIAYSMEWVAEEPDESKQASENIFSSFQLKTHLERTGWKVVEKEWRPEDLKDGDWYWFINDRGIIYKGCWHDYIADKYRLKTKNVFKDQQSAEEALKKIME